MTDRYADAVRARRAELRAVRSELSGSHRAELRTALALARISASDATSAALRGLSREARRRAETADRAGRVELPAAVGAAVAAVATSVDEALVGELGPALRRAAGARGLGMPAGWPRFEPPRLPDVADAWPQRPAGRTHVVAGAVEGMALWRAALVPLAALPLLGLPALGGPALAPLAVGIAAAGLAVAISGRRVVAERAALRRGVDEAVAAARVAIDADVARRLVELERVAGVELDRAVERRRAAVDAELRALSSEVANG